ncbi:MAG: amidophosphoribosyltransferase [Clostridia bacterium]|nr:amidophosphoribosyltransferase [Clostridia bacterium]
MNQLREECGVFGVFSNTTADVASMAYYGLFALQHRGQESCGIVVNDDGVFRSYRDKGIVNDVFTKEILQGLGTGNIAVGHCRYGTTGSDGRINAQPILIKHIKGSMALAHNGNLTNAYELRTQLELEGSIFRTTSDTEVIPHVIIKERVKCGSIEAAVNAAMDKIKGAYSLVIASPSKLIAARDENGFRPLCYGVLDDGSYVVASESCALDAVGAKLVRSVDPGEIIVFDKNGPRSIRDHCGKAPEKFCMFEYIYFSRPDSVIDGTSVHEARVRAGACLAMEHPVQADCVIGVPDSGLDAAIGYSRMSGIPYSIGFIKNKYIGRTFINPGQESRSDKVRIKLNPIRSVVEGKRVVVVDDSIFRGTTSARIVKMIRDAGATEVHMMSSAPAFLNPCYYGVDIDNRDNLIAVHHTPEEIAEIIGADSVGYLSLDSLPKLAPEQHACTYCSACFDGNYPTEVPSTQLKNKFEQKISESSEEDKDE